MISSLINCSYILIDFNKSYFTHVYQSLRHVPVFSFSYLAALETENALRRSRIEAELAASRTATEIALRRSRLEA